MTVFAALADSTRRTILDLLRVRERTAGELVEAFPDLSQPAVSRHLRVLRDVGLVQARPREQQRIYTLRPEALAEVDAWLAQYREFWVPRLEALALHLNRVAIEQPPANPDQGDSSDEPDRG